MKLLDEKLMYSVVPKEFILTNFVFQEFIA